MFSWECCVRTHVYVCVFVCHIMCMCIVYVHVGLCVHMGELHVCIHMCMCVLYVYL